MLIYVASPYTHQSAATRQIRYEIVTNYIAQSFKRQPYITRISPITYFHPLVKLHNLPIHAKPYTEWNRSLLKQCEAMDILKIPGLEDSKGVNMEIDWATKFSILINYIDERDYL